MERWFVSEEVDRVNKDNYNKDESNDTAAMITIAENLNSNLNSNSKCSCDANRKYDQSLLIISPVTECCHLAIGDWN